MSYFVTIGGRVVKVDVEPEGIWIDDVRVDADLAALGSSSVNTLLVDGASYKLVATRAAAGRWTLHMGGRVLELDVVDERTRIIREMSGGGATGGGPRSVKAPMPGLVIKVEVAEGDEVQPGQGLVIVEAMKMENELRAEAHATVARVRVAPGEAVEKDQVLLDFHPHGEGA